MGTWTLTIMLLLVFQLQVQYTVAQGAEIFDARNIKFTAHTAPVSGGTDMMHLVPMSPLLKPSSLILSKGNYLPLNHYNSTQWRTFSLRYNNNNTDDWLNEHNMVMVKSVIHVINRLVVGINCHYNWCFTIAGNGAGMVLNRLPIKIYLAGVIGDVPDLGHR